MKMKPSATLLAAKDLEASKRFFAEVLGVGTLMDMGGNVMLECGIALQELGSWCEFLLGKPAESVHFGGEDFEIVLETDDLDAFLQNLDAHPEVERVHEPRTYPWGQRVVRVYDPDRHIIEVGESMELVVKRFLLEGSTVEQTVERTMFPPEYVLGCKAQLEAEGRL